MASSPPLAGLRVLDLSRVLAGPFCCQLLAELGADVVKVERPGTGDDTRHWGPPFVGTTGTSAYFLSCNRNKRSIALDLDRAECRPLLEGLVQAADVLIENFLPKDLEKFGLTPSRLAQLNSNLVSCSISGFGRSGPLADVPGYDLIVQASSGLMSITGDAAGEPMKVGVAITDIITGLYAAVSALAGIFARDRGGGFTADLALFDCTLASLVNVAQSALITGSTPARYGNAHPQIVPYEAFATADGHLVLGVGNDRQWQKFCAAVGLTELAADERFKSNPQRVVHRAQLIPQLQALFSARTTREWETLLQKAGIPHAAVQTVREALDAPQTAARQMLVDVAESAGITCQALATPVHWPGRSVSTAATVPALGEHTREILCDWLRYSPQQIEDLQKAGVIE